MNTKSPAWATFAMKAPRAAMTPEALRKNIHGLPASLLLVAIQFYQSVFSPVMPVGCKFYPSCSRYAAEAIARHGAKRGLRLAVERLWRCRPFTKGGVDLVPDVGEEQDEAESGMSKVHS